MLLIKKDNYIDTTVYRKTTNTDVYLHWESFAPTTWKRGTLRTLLQRAFIICSTDDLRIKEINHISTVFEKINMYPRWLINEVINNIQTKNTTLPSENSQIDIPSTEKLPMLILPYQGKQGENVIKSLKNKINRYTTQDQKLKIIFTGTKLSSNFNIKDKTKIEHEHNLVYKVQCPAENCRETYVGETARRFIERIKDHQGRDHNSHFVKHSIEKSHEIADIKDFEILSKTHRYNYSRKITEALLIKKIKPSLNTQEKSIPLKLFN